MSGKTTAPDKASEKAGSEKSTPRQDTKKTETADNSLFGFSFLQRKIGNQAVQKLFKSGALQAKLTIGEANDIHEQEADRVADQVMRMPEDSVGSDRQSVIGKGNKSTIQLKPG